MRASEPNGALPKAVVQNANEAGESRGIKHAHLAKESWCSWRSWVPAPGPLEGARPAR